jgi:hypothetical protein
MSSSGRSDLDLNDLTSLVAADPVSRRAALKTSFSSAVVALFFGTACSKKDDDSTALDETCTNTCEWAYDGECDDGGPGSQYNLCTYGSDCDDCGTRYGYGDTYSNSYSDYSDSYSDTYSDYSNSYSNYSNSYSNYSNSYYNYSNYTTYYNYFSNSW